MNCIFICIFYNSNKLDILYLLLESLFIYGNLDDNTNILIYTSNDFMNIIKKNQLFNNNKNKINFEINDNYDNIEKSYKSKLYFFSLPSSINYKKILYLDTDIIVKYDINKIFEVCNDDVLYVSHEGEINSDTDNKSVITNGILLFNNCEKMKDLFDKINKDIIYRPCDFINNNCALKLLVANNDYNIYSDKIIHQFSDESTNHMTIFLKNIKLNIYNNENNIWACSYKMQLDIDKFFILNKKFKIADISYNNKGHSAIVLSKVFSKVFAVGNSIVYLNKDIINIEYVLLDIYQNNWDILPDDIDVAYIDADYSHKGYKNNIDKCLKKFKNLKYIIFYDYGVWVSMQEIITEFIDNKILNFEINIGIINTPGPYGIINNLHEGIICSVNNELIK